MMVGAGSLRAEMLQDVGVSEVRVELVRIEKFGNVQRDHTADRVVLEPEASLPAGQIRECCREGCGRTCESSGRSASISSGVRGRIR